MPASELPSQPGRSTATPELKAPTHSADARPSSETTTRYSEPGELYGAADLYRQSTSARTSAPDWPGDGDESVTAEIRRDSNQHYATVRPFEQATSAATPDSSDTDRAAWQAKVPALAPSQPKSAPTLSMMETYGRESEAPTQFRWGYGAILILIVLFAGGVGLGGWYWWSHRTSAVQTPVETPTPNPTSLSQQPLPSPATNPTSNNQVTTTGNADEEMKLLRDRRMKSQPSDNAQVVAAIIAAEKKYPSDYRFPYERAKLSIVGVTSHHEAFGALAMAAEKAIDNGKAQEMLDNLNGDSSGDFFKLSRGHAEWRTLQEALRNKDKEALASLRH